MPKCLDELHRLTGLVFMAVCSGGATLTNPGRWSASFEELLERVPTGLSMIIPIVCGNDLLVNWKVPVFQEAWATAAARLCDGMRAKSSVQFAVVGGSSETWRYKWMTQSQRELYDANARRLAEVLSGCGVTVTTGVEELQGVEIADGVGHVRSSSKAVVFAAYVSWVNQCLRCEAEQELAELTQELSLIHI